MSGRAVVEVVQAGSGPPLVVTVDGPDELLASAREGLPEGPAAAEAAAVRLEWRGVPVERRPCELPAQAARRLARELGRSSVRMLRADPSLVAGMRVGSWFEGSWRGRTVRRARVARLGGRAVDAAFWAGVRAEATRAEWRRLTRSSYVALAYHRLAGEGKPGQERLDLPPEQLAAQLRLLRRLGFRPLALDDLVAFHAGEREQLPRRSFVVTVDDGFRDCVEPLLRHADARPQLYVPTLELGGSSWWAGDEPVAGWEEVARLAAAGVAIGSHSRRHASLPDVPDEELADELAGSREDLAERLGSPPAALAYPHGRQDERVVRAARAAGYRLAFTTLPGANGAGSDPYRLRRIGVKAWDSRLSFLWKAATGELLPERWEARRVRRARRGSRRRRPTPARPAA
jgi:peptidoglycan/xylan/chitin deacetylase (PgdA/CDA1 family)